MHPHLGRQPLPSASVSAAARFSSSSKSESNLRSYYDACDQLGVLVYHDMMFAVETGQPHLAYVSDVVEAELRYQIRRLSAHPSIAIWDGCNGAPQRVP